MQHMNGIVPHLLDYWADPVVHLLLLKNSMAWQYLYETRHKIVRKCSVPRNEANISWLCFCWSNCFRNMSCYAVDTPPTSMGLEQCDQIGLFWKGLGTIFLAKVKMSFKLLKRGIENLIENVILLTNGSIKRCVTLLIPFSWGGAFHP